MSNPYLGSTGDIFAGENPEEVQKLRQEIQELREAMLRWKTRCDLVEHTLRTIRDTSEGALWRLDE